MMGGGQCFGKLLEFDREVVESNFENDIKVGDVVVVKSKSKPVAEAANTESFV